MEMMVGQEQQPTQPVVEKKPLWEDVIDAFVAPLAGLGQAEAAICPKCAATLKLSEKPGTQTCWNCGWSPGTA